MTHHSVIPDDRNPVDVLADEFASRLRSGESPSMQEYIERYPEYADEIQELFPGVALLEQLSEKQESEASNCPRPRQDRMPSGHRFGDIEIIREVGRGGMGIVYEAYQHSLNRSVALKAMSGSALNSAKQAARFQREAQAAAQLHHTNIVPVFGVGEQEGISYYVMQLIHGLGLDAILSELARKANGREAEIHDEDVSSDSEARTPLSARDFADVLVSGQLSESAVRTLGGSTSTATPPPRNPEIPPTVVYQQGPPDEASSAIEHRAEDRTEDHTGEMSSTDTPRSFVPSSLELADASPPAASVRSSHVLQEEPPQDETFVLRSDSASAVVAEDPRLASLGPRYWRNIARIGLQVASGLHYAHAQGTLHRDIKPANILLDTDGTAWIADFGLAKLLQQEDVTKTGDVVGTLRYMAPEQFRGEADGRSDLYSFGLTLYELLTLRPAYDDTDRQQLIAKKLTPHDPPAPRRYHSGIPRDLETIVLKCLAWEPDRRYQSAGALVADLQAFLEDRPIKARRISPVERFGRWCKRQPLVATLSALVLLLLTTMATLASIGYVQEKDRAEQMATLIDEKEQANADLERIAEVSWQALEDIYNEYVPDRFTGPVEASAEVEDDDESGIETESTTTVLSPQTAAVLEGLLATFDQIAVIRGSDATHLEKTANANRKVGDLHLRLGQHAEAVQAFERASERYRLLERINGPKPQSSLMLARIFNGLSIAEEQLDQRTRARESLERSLTILGRPELDPSDPTVRFERATTHYLMARHPPFVRNRGSGRERGPRSGRNGPGRDAGRNGGEARRPGVAHSSVEAAPTAEETSSSEAGLDRSERRRPPFDFGVSREHLQIATSILEPLIEEFPAVPEYQFLLALCQIELSHRWIDPDEDGREKRLGEDGREKRLGRAIVILAELVAEYPTEPDYLYQLSEAYEQRYFKWKAQFSPLFWQELFDSESRTDLSDIAGAELDLKEAVRLSEDLLRQQPNVPRYADSHVWLLFNFADVYAAQGEMKQARKHLQDAVELRKLLSQRFPEAGEGQRWRSNRVELLLAYVLARGRHYELARDQLQELADSMRDEPRRRSDQTFRAVLLLLTETHRALGESVKADEVRREAQRILEQSERTHSMDPRGRSPQRGSRRGSSN